MIYVGIDIAKLNHFATAIPSQGEILIEPFKFTNDYGGFYLLLSKLAPLDQNSIIIGLVSDISGKSSTSIVDYLLEQSGNSINHEEIASKLLRSLKSKEHAVIESIEGYQMADSQKYRMRLVRAHMDYITAEINDVDSEIESVPQACISAIRSCSR